MKYQIGDRIMSDVRYYGELMKGTVIRVNQCLSTEPEEWYSVLDIIWDDGEKSTHVQGWWVQRLVEPNEIIKEIL